ncbi:hypothetical protein N0V88_001615 [Collariella sp. IMI 366227]|nr:hypothetical protein N0V88_001615 [Collariella sp. IMI 366227]
MLNSGLGSAKAAYINTQESANSFLAAANFGGARAKYTANENTAPQNTTPQNTAPGNTAPKNNQITRQTGNIANKPALNYHKNQKATATIGKTSPKDKKPISQGGKSPKTVSGHTNSSLNRSLQHSSAINSKRSGFWMNPIHLSPAPKIQLDTVEYEDSWFARANMPKLEDQPIRESVIIERYRKTIPTMVEPTSTANKSIDERPKTPPHLSWKTAVKDNKLINQRPKTPPNYSSKHPSTRNSPRPNICLSPSEIDDLNSQQREDAFCAAANMPKLKDDQPVQELVIIERYRKTTPTMVETVPDTSAVSERPKGPPHPSSKPHSATINTRLSIPLSPVGAASSNTPEIVSAAGVPEVGKTVPEHTKTSPELISETSPESGSAVSATVSEVSAVLAPMISAMTAISLKPVPATSPKLVSATLQKPVLATSPKPVLTTIPVSTTLPKRVYTTNNARPSNCLNPTDAANLDSLKLRNDFFSIVDARKGVQTNYGQARTQQKQVSTNSTTERVSTESSQKRGSAANSRRNDVWLNPIRLSPTETAELNIQKRKDDFCSAAGIQLRGEVQTPPLKDDKLAPKGDESVADKAALKEDKIITNKDKTTSKSDPHTVPQLQQADLKTVFNLSTASVKPITTTSKAPQAFKTQNLAKISSSDWKNTSYQPVIYTTNYWEVQRVAKGTVDLYTYPEAHCQGPWNPNREDIITDAEWKPLPYNQYGRITPPSQGEQGATSTGPWDASSPAKKLVSRFRPFRKELTPTSRPNAPPKVALFAPGEPVPLPKVVTEGYKTGTSAHPAGAGASNDKSNNQEKPTEVSGQTEPKRLPPHMRRKAPHTGRNPKGVTGESNTGSATEAHAHDAEQDEPKRSAPHKGSAPKPPAPEQPSAQVVRKTLDLAELKRHGMPRPNKNYVASLPSMVSSVSFWHNTSDNGIPEDRPADIRSVIGPKHNFHQTNGVWQKYNWSNPLGRDDDDMWAVSYLTRWITTWMDGIPESPIVTFQPDPPILPLESILAPSKLDKKTKWRSENFTSEILAKRHGLDQASAIGRHRRYRGYEHIQDLIDDDMILKIEEPVFERAEYHPYIPQFPCHLRPAEKTDMPAIRDIYNHEIQHGLQALDISPLTTADFETILTTCETLGMPFLVAVRGSARDIKGSLTTPKNSHTIRAVCNQRPAENNPESQPRGQVVGFTYLSVYQRGLACSAGGTARASARMHLYVHPECRRKRIGFSLVDMLLTAVSTFYISEQTYDFVDVRDREVYHKAKHAKRRFNMVYLSFFVRHKEATEGDHELAERQKGYDDELVWVRGWLEKMRVEEVARFEAAHWSGEGERRERMWLDEVVFEHRCGV